MAQCTSLNLYLRLITDAWRRNDGVTLADWISLRHSHVASKKLYVENPEGAIEMILDSPLDELVVAHLKCIMAVKKGDFAEACGWQQELVQLFQKIFQMQYDENWALPVLYVVCVDLRLLVQQAYRHLVLRGVGKPLETLEKTAEILMSCFRVCAADNRANVDSTKRWGMLKLVNQLFKLYFRMNKLHLCKPLIRAIESSPYKDQFPLSQRITYRYYVGRKYMFGSDYKTADCYLTFAFIRCHKLKVKNKRLILLYLTPVKMLMGYLPKRSMLEKYNLLPYWEVASAVKIGNLCQLSTVCVQFEKFFIDCGVFLILEKLKYVCIRNLFKRVYDILKNSRIPVKAFLIALKLMQYKDIDMDETMCILTNLINEGKIKGYISYQHQLLILSKQQPFPPLATLVV